MKDFNETIGRIIGVKLPHYPTATRCQTAVDDRLRGCWFVDTGQFLRRINNRFQFFGSLRMCLVRYVEHQLRRLARQNWKDWHENSLEVA